MVFNFFSGPFEDAMMALQQTNSGPLSLISCVSVRETSPIDDVDLKCESKKKRFHPFRNLRRMFRRKSRRLDVSVVDDCFDPRSDESAARRRSGSLAPGLSLSHDSVFKPDPTDSGNSSPDLENSSLSIPILIPKPRFQAELADVVRQRFRVDDSDDEDLGLPQSRCSSAGDCLDKIGDRTGKSQSSCSEGSLLSTGSSLEDDPIGAGSELDLKITRHKLSHNAAKHKMAVRPRRNHAPANKRPEKCGSSLPATPEVNEDSPRPPEPAVEAPQNLPDEAPPPKEENLPEPTQKSPPEPIPSKPPLARKPTDWSSSLPSSPPKAIWPDGHPERTGMYIKKPRRDSNPKPPVQKSHSFHKEEVKRLYVKKGALKDKSTSLEFIGALEKTPPRSASVVLTHEEPKYANFRSLLLGKFEPVHHGYENIEIIELVKKETPEEVRRKSSSAEEEKVTLRKESTSAEEEKVALWKKPTSTEEPDKLELRKKSTSAEEEKVTLRSKWTSAEEEKVTLRKKSTSAKEEKVTLRRKSEEPDKLELRKKSTSAEEEKVTLRSKPNSAEEPDKSPLRKKSTSAEEEKATFRRKSNSTEEPEKVMLWKKPTSAEEEKVTLRRKPTSTDEPDKSPLRKKSTSAEEEKVTLRRKPTSTDEPDKIPLRKKSTSAEEEKVTLRRKSTSTDEPDKIPLRTKSTSAEEEVTLRRKSEEPDKVPLRKKSTSAEEPELLKVFARRSLKRDESDKENEDEKPKVETSPSVAELKNKLNKPTVVTIIEKPKKEERILEPISADEDGFKTIQDRRREWERRLQAAK